MNVIELLAEPLSYTFMIRALSVTIIASVLCALLSCWLVLIGWSLMGDAVSHAVLPGVVLAYIVGAPFALGALIFGFLAVALIGGVRDTTKLKEDAAIGIVFTTLFSFGHIDLNHIIFGNLLGVSSADLWQVLILGAVTFAILILKRKDFTLYAFDQTHAHALGMNPRIIGAVLLGLLAMTSVVALQAVGVILVVAMLIIPGATAFLLTDKFSKMLVIAPALAAGAGILGVYTSYFLDTSTGGMVVLAQGLIFTLVYLFSPRQGLVATRIAASERRKSLAGVR